MGLILKFLFALFNIRAPCKSVFNPSGEKFFFNILFSFRRVSQSVFAQHSFWMGEYFFWRLWFFFFNFFYVLFAPLRPGVGMI
jgi:hypothetical protein